MFVLGFTCLIYQITFLRFFLAFSSCSLSFMLINSIASSVEHRIEFSNNFFFFSLYMVLALIFSMGAFFSPRIAFILCGAVALRSIQITISHMEGCFNILAKEGIYGQENPVVILLGWLLAIIGLVLGLSLIHI